MDNRGHSGDAEPDRLYPEQTADEKMASMDGQPNDPRHQLNAAWQAASAALGEWRKQIAEATSEAVDKLEPAVRAAADAARSAVTGEWRACRCTCASAHPDDKGVCDGKAVVTRRVAAADVSMCAPCAVAQGVAEFRH
jgi:hypothetical protein